ncbi:Panacea domain-containing protein [Ruegeria sp. HKCCA4812]|uniref:Panacea domain-containing protein n=1 Tax=Ruegeria sp. HKCCA4812 TaxID=2682993 RepID=UPI001487ACCB|nr:type II toxin-antitoxin system antitoxin SocA domain-containing protein [Ruegeria sp. HKCCA4812]
MHDARYIANRFIELARQDGNVLTPMQLLKLVYIAHGWMLGLYGVPLIRDRVEAWKFGPVIPKLYHAVKHCKDGPVIQTLNVVEEELVPAEETLLQEVYEIYGDISGVGLSNLTHQAGTPWDRVYVEGISNIPISNDIVQEHYHALSEA